MKATAIWATLAASLALGLNVNAETVEWSARTDGFYKEVRPNISKDGLQFLVVSSLGEKAQRAWMHFELPFNLADANDEPGDTLNSAKVRLHIESVSKPGDFWLNAIVWQNQTGTGVVPETHTWNNPAGQLTAPFIPPSVFTVTEADVGSYVDIDITELLGAYEAQPPAVPLGIVIRPAFDQFPGQFPTAIVRFSSSESSNPPLFEADVDIDPVRPPEPPAAGNTFIVNRVSVPPVEFFPGEAIMFSSSCGEGDDDTSGLFPINMLFEWGDSPTMNADGLVRSRETYFSSSNSDVGRMQINIKNTTDSIKTYPKTITTLCIPVQNLIERGN